MASASGGAFMAGLTVPTSDVFKGLIDCFVNVALLDATICSVFTFFMIEHIHSATSCVNF